MKKLIVEFNRLNPMLKTIWLVVFTISIVSIIAIMVKLTGKNYDLSSFISTNITFTAIMQVINAFFLMSVLTKISKKEANDRYLRKDIFTRLKTLEEDLKIEKDNIFVIKKEILDIKKELTNKK